MSSLATSIPGLGRHPRLRRRVALALLAAALLAGAGFLGATLAGPSAGRSPHPRAAAARGGVVRADGGRVALGYPADWAPASARAAAGPGTGTPLAVLRRADGRGVVVLRAEPPLRGSLGHLGAQLTRALARRVPDLRPVATRVVKLRSGRAFAYTFARTRAHRVQSVVVAQVGGRTYALDAASDAASPDAAREAAAIVASFGPAS